MNGAITLQRSAPTDNQSDAQTGNQSDARTNPKHVRPVSRLGGPLWRKACSAADATPSDRDRVVDLLRSFSLAVVVVGHILMAVVVWKDGVPSIGNLLGDVPVLQIATWALQIMPVFFLAGACANALSWERARARGVSWSSWSYDRLARLVRPVAVYLGSWVVLVTVAQHVLGSHVAAPLAALSTQLLWFLGVYIPVTAMTPWLVRLARVAPWKAPLCALAIAAAMDALRFATGAQLIGMVNFVVVWAMAAQLGLAITRARPSNKILWLIAATGLATNILLVTVGPYPVSMVGMPGAGISNMSPPTVVLAIHCWILTSLVALAWPWLEKVARRPRVWRATVAIGGSSMTLYLWHLTALILVTIGEHEIGFDRGTQVGSALFWMMTVVHIAVTVSVAWILVTIFAGFEYAKFPWLDNVTALPPHIAQIPRPLSRDPLRLSPTGLSVAGMVACSFAFLILAATGMAGFPFRHISHYAGIALYPGYGFALLVVGVAAARSGARRCIGQHN